jgi:FkbH-like protein
LYAEEASRRSARDPHADYASYLASLDLRAEVSTLTPANLDRVLQLSLRSNQFNFRTHRYSRKELVAALEDPQRVWTLLSLRDRFGDYGLVAVVDAVLARAGGAEIRNWFMSCRVLQRGMEACTMNQLAKRLRAAGATQVRLPFSPTPKNGLVAELPRVLGWSSDAESPNLWHLDLASYSPLKTPIQVSAS